MQRAERDDVADVLNVSDREEFDDALEQLLERGKAERVMILSGTEGDRPDSRSPYARTNASITFRDEGDLRECVRLLRWSDERLRKRPDQLMLWQWDHSFREGMTIQFGVNWYDAAFFERRRDAFREPSHTRYYRMFGASPDDFKIEHVILGE